MKDLQFEETGHLGNTGNGFSRSDKSDHLSMPSKCPNLPFSKINFAFRRNSEFSLPIPSRSDMQSRFFISRSSKCKYDKTKNVD